MSASVARSGESALGARGLTGTGLPRSRLLGHRSLRASVPRRHPAAGSTRGSRVPGATAAGRAEVGARLGSRRARAFRGSRPAPASTSPRTARGSTASGPHPARGSWRSTSSPTWRGGLPAISTGPGTRSSPAGPGLTLLVETARYWASRIRLDEDGRGHIEGVIGPDEYHENVDDNAYTNVMARWNLRRAASAAMSVEGADVEESELTGWLELASTLVDGYDADDGDLRTVRRVLGLEPLVIAELARDGPSTRSVCSVASACTAHRS